MIGPTLTLEWEKEDHFEKCCPIKGIPNLTLECDIEGTEDPRSFVFEHHLNENQLRMKFELVKINLK